MEFSRPLRVTGGLAVRSKRGQIGEAWWSRRFLQVLESLQLGGRLARGRNYARQGQVMSLTVEPGSVRADVQGSRSHPYAVHLTLPELTRPQWDHVESAFAGAALFRAALLAGELPPEIEDVFAACGTPLFPTAAAELGMECSCPDWSVPCKHVAAVCYVLAEAFDADPFLVLAWRGRDKESLLERLRRTNSAAPHWTDGLAERPLAECVDNFWTPPGRVPASGHHRGVPASGDGLLRTLTPPALTVRRKPLIDVLAPAYTALASSDE
jgi:uncharacterized Zn finger protein